MSSQVEKKCKKCNDIKHLFKFHRDGRNKDETIRYKEICIICNNKERKTSQKLIYIGGFIPWIDDETREDYNYFPHRDN